jgi:hypothetical protein
VFANQKDTHAESFLLTTRLVRVGACLTTSGAAALPWVAFWLANTVPPGQAGW